MKQKIDIMSIRLKEEILRINKILVSEIVAKEDGSPFYESNPVFFTTKINNLRLELNESILLYLEYQ